MKYRNTKTGVTVTVASRIIGGDWVEVVPQQVRPVVAEKATVPAKKATVQASPKPTPVATMGPTKSDGSFENTTVKQIKQELDAMGIKYSQTAKKQELYDLMMGK
jgi:hypothetical protein